MELSVELPGELPGELAGELPKKFHYKFYDLKAFHVVQLNGHLPDEIPLEFLNSISNIVLNPQNVLINCFTLYGIPFHWINTFSSLHFLLLNHNKKIGVIFANSSVKGTLSMMGAKMLAPYESLELFISDFLPPTRQVSFNFVKSYLYCTVRTLFIQFKSPAYRKSITVKENQGDDKSAGGFAGDLNVYIQVRSSDYFYIISVSLPERTFLNIISAMLDEVYNEISDDIVDGGIELVNIILGQAKKTVNTDGGKLQFLPPKMARGNIFPEEKIQFNSKEFVLGQMGQMVVVQFSGLRGDFVVEIWFPLEFKQQVLKAIKA